MVTYLKKSLLRSNSKQTKRLDWLLPMKKKNQRRARTQLILTNQRNLIIHYIFQIWWRMLLQKYKRIQQHKLKQMPHQIAHNRWRRMRRNRSAILSTNNLIKILNKHKWILSSITNSLWIRHHRVVWMRQMLKLIWMQAELKLTTKLSKSKLSSRTAQRLSWKKITNHR